MQDSRQLGNPVAFSLSACRLHDQTAMSSSDTVLIGGADAPPQELVDAGAALIRALDAAAAGPDVAFWLRFQDAGDWRLLLAEGRLLRHGLRVAQDRIRRLLSAR